MPLLAPSSASAATRPATAFASVNVRAGPLRASWRTRAAPLVKVCGITSVADAEQACSSGADLLGMILWPKAKRSVDDDTAAAISAVARKHGARPVGVFVDEDAATIVERCRRTGVEFAQLHGDAARQALFDLPRELKVVYVMHATSDGVVQTPTPTQLAQTMARVPRQVEYLLMDSLKGGSGMAFDWNTIEVPRDEATLGWLLAGGLTPDNVGLAVATARPTGVDVSSGVCGPDGLQKDHVAVQRFVANATSGARDAVLGAT